MEFKERILLFATSLGYLVLGIFMNVVNFHIVAMYLLAYIIIDILEEGIEKIKKVYLISKKLLLISMALALIALAPFTYAAQVYQASIYIFSISLGILGLGEIYETIKKI